MTEWIRVKDKKTGHEQTINKDLFDEGEFERLDKAATDTEGRPLPGKPNANLPKAQPPDTDAAGTADNATDTSVPAAESPELAPPPEADPSATTTPSKSGRAGRA